MTRVAPPHAGQAPARRPALLLLDTASDLARVGYVSDGARAERTVAGGRGLAEALPALLQAVLVGRPDAVGCVVGPGSFTGLRAGLALAHGWALGAGIPLVGVTVGEAFRATRHEPLWVVTRAGENRVFVDRGDADGVVAIAVADLDDLPCPVAGDAAALFPGATRTGGAQPTLDDLDAAARARLEGRLPPRAALPLYVDPPRVTAAPPARPPPLP